MEYTKSGNIVEFIEGLGIALKCNEDLPPLYYGICPQCINNSLLVNAERQEWCCFECKLTGDEIDAYTFLLEGEKDLDKYRNCTIGRLTHDNRPQVTPYKDLPEDEQKKIDEVYAKMRSGN